MKNKLKVQFSKPEYGWMTLTLKSNNKPIIYIACSGVFNPFYDYVDILYDIKHNKRKIELYIDQEGYDAKLTFKVKNKCVYLETETLRDNLRKNDLPKYKGVFYKKQLLKEMKNSLLNVYKRNRHEMNSDFYPFTFNKNKLKKI